MGRKKLHSLNDLLRAYQDLEKTLAGLRATAERSLPFESSLRQIDVRKLISRLSTSKRRLELKIGNTLLLEKQHLKRRLRAIAANFGQQTPNER